MLQTLRSTPRSVRASAVTLAATGSLAFAALTPAHAATVLATPSGVHVSAVTPSSFTVSANTTANALRYRLFYSTTKSDVYVANIAKARHTALATSPKFTVAGLPFTSAPYYYRLEAMRTDTWRTWSEVLTVGLKPAMPTAVQATSPAGGTYLTWNSSASTGFQIAQGTNYTQTTNRHTYTINGPSHQFSPFNLYQGVTYYFRVRSLNSGTPSAWSPRVTVRQATRQQSVRVMAWNVLAGTFDGTPAGDQIVAPWAQRKVVAANLIKENDPDVVAIQEAAAWTAGLKSPRQIDSLVTQLTSIGAHYTLARTEVPPTESHYFRTGNYVLIKTSAYVAVGTGGFFTIGTNRWAAYQVVRNRATGAKALFVSPHLVPNAGATYDAVRQQEMISLADQAETVATQYGVPIVYAGDFNSTVNKNHAFRRPGHRAAVTAIRRRRRRRSLSNKHPVQQLQPVLPDGTGVRRSHRPHLHRSRCRHPRPEDCAAPVGRQVHRRHGLGSQRPGVRRLPALLTIKPGGRLISVPAIRRLAPDRTALVNDSVPPTARPSAVPASVRRRRSVGPRTSSTAPPSSGSWQRPLCASPCRSTAPARRHQVLAP